MGKSEPLTSVVSRAMYLLRMHSRQATRSRRMTFGSLPLDTDKTFEGVSLQRIISPETAATGLETEQLFDIWMWPHFTPGDGDSVADLKEHNAELCQFVTAAEGFGVQTVRLLYALGNAPGARLAWDGDTIMVHHDDKSYGIIDGQVTSRFCTGAKVAVDHRAVLLDTAVMRTFDADFCSLYREAYRQGKGLVDVLVALAMRVPPFNFRRMGKEALGSRKPSTQQMGGWVTILTRKKDPVSALYKQLVPKWLTIGEFSRVICSMGSRPLEPDAASRQLYINKLYKRFHSES